MTLRARKEAEYRAYIDEHINNVKTVFNAMKRMELVPPEILPQLEKNVEAHDKSKYSEEEFDGYRCKFFPVSDSEKFAARSAFGRAWEHHKIHNLHHWESPTWFDPKTRTAKPMDPVYVYEMICDWQAMSLKFGGNCLEWFQSQTRMYLAPETRALAISIMEKIITVF